MKDGPIGLGDRVKPHSSAVVQIRSKTQGFKIPEMTTAERDAIATPDNGLEIFNLDTNQKNIYTGLKWATLGGSKIAFNVEQIAHGRTIGCIPTPVYLDTSIWTDGKADAQSTLATHVIVEVIDVDNFTVAQIGRFECTAHGLTVEESYYTSDTVDGALVIAEPMVYSNPVLFIEDANNIHVTNLRASANTGATGTGAVASVFGRNGAVVAVAGDYTADEITNVPAGNIAAIEVQAALAELDSEKQATSLELDGLDTIVGTGLVARTAVGTYLPRTLQATSTKISLVNADGVAGNPGIDVDETNIDHDNLLNFVLNEHIDWTGSTSNFSTSGTVSSGSQSITGSVVLTGLVDGRDVATDGVKLDGVESLADVTDAANVAAAGALMDGDFSSDGLMVRTAAGTYTNRTIIAGSAKVLVLDGDGVAGNPSIDFDETQIDHDNLLNFVANEHIDHTTVGLDVSLATSGLIGGGDATASRALRIDINSQTLDSTPNSIDEFFVWDVSLNTLRKTRLQDIVASFTPPGGEANTASNVGLGSGVFRSKVGVDLTLRSIVAGSTKLSVVQNADDITLDVVPTNISITDLIGYNANNYVDHTSVSVLGGTGLSGGGNIAGNQTIVMDIPSLSASVPVEAADLIVIYDDSLAAHRKMTRSDFLVGLATAPVDSVFGRTGAVVAVGGDYDATEITNAPSGNIAAVTTQAAVDELDTEKEATITGAATTITGANLTVSRALVSDGSGKVGVSAVTSTELGYVSGVTSSIQTQIDNISVFPEFTIFGGVSSVAGNSTKAASYGHTAANGGLTMLRNGEITGISVRLNNARTGGTCIASSLINGVVQNAAGETVTIDGTNTQGHFQVIAAPIAYVAGDTLSVQTTTTGFSPTGADAVITIWVRDR